MRLERLVDALTAARVDVTGEELADAIWLAGHLGDGHPTGTREPAPDCTHAGDSHPLRDPKIQGRLSNQNARTNNEWLM